MYAQTFQHQGLTVKGVSFPEGFHIASAEGRIGKYRQGIIRPEDQPVVEFGMLAQKEKGSDSIGQSQG